MRHSLDIIFAGTPEFSVPPLAALLGSEHRVVAVYTQPDRTAGRGRKLRSSPVKQLAVEHEIPVYQPKKLKNEADLAVLESHQADLMVVVAYGLILPRRVLNAPRLGCINIHASLLPRWRGAAPIQRAILAGDAQSGITLMQMEQGLDTGPMLYKLACPIEANETGGSLHDKLSELAARALMEALPQIAAQSTRPEIQDESEANYARKLDKSEARIDWNRSAVELDRQVRAFNPWPVAQTDYGSQVMRIWQTRLLNKGSNAQPGSVIRYGRDGIDVATGDGLLRIITLQMPGKRAISAADFINAHNVEGAVFK